MARVIGEVVIALVCALGFATLIAYLSDRKFQTQINAAFKRMFS